jgi:glucan phosphoethanolaminetransferase (alkaline phosphatase superfamily)
LRDAQLRSGPFQLLSRIGTRDGVAALLIVSGTLLCGAPELLARLTGLAANPGSLLLFVSIWMVSLIGLLMAGLYAPLLVRVFYGFVFAASAALVTTNYLSMHESLEVTQFERTVIGAYRFAPEAMAQYRTQLLVGIALAAPLLIGFLLPRKAARAAHPSYLAVAGSAAPLVLIFIVAAISWARGGQGTKGLPANIRPAAYASVLLFDHFFGPTSLPRRQVIDKFDAQKSLRNVVYVVDESIVSDVFDKDSEISIFAKIGSLESAMHDFGPATSTSNCSWDSNLLLRVGPRQAHLPEDLATYPTIWEYAKRAGYTTTYIDMQDRGDVLPNGMTQAERAHIDTVISAQDIPLTERDGRAGQIVRKLLDDGHRNFIYVNKLGAHFPWDSKYPSDATRYAPILNASRDSGLAYVSPSTAGLFDAIAGLAGTPPFKNSYRNAVEWNFNTFFEALQGGDWPSHSVMIYTSDHGQNVFKEGGHPNTHCSSGDTMAKSEGRVPLMVFTQVPYWSSLLENREKVNRGRLSQFALFATATAFMGFPADGQVLARDPSIFSQGIPLDYLRVATQISVRFGRPIYWSPICGLAQRLEPSGKCSAAGSH